MWRQPSTEPPQTKFHKGDRVRIRGGLYLSHGDYREAQGDLGEILYVNAFGGNPSYLCRLEDGQGFFGEDKLEDFHPGDWLKVLLAFGTDHQELKRNSFLSNWEEAVESKASLEILEQFYAIATQEFPPSQELIGTLIGVNHLAQQPTIAIAGKTTWTLYATRSLQIAQILEGGELELHSVAIEQVHPLCPIHPQKNPIEYFMPSNGSQGEVFMDAYCYRCKHDAFDRGGEACQILCTALANEQPQEWRYIDGQPTCTAFEEWNPDEAIAQPKPDGASSGLPKTYSKRRSLMKVSGWIEFQSKTTTGKKGKKTYEYYYYRWEEWEGDRLLRTPSKRVKAQRVRLLKSLIDRVDFDVRDILARAEDWAY